MVSFHSVFAVNAQFQGNKDLGGSLNGLCNGQELKGNLTLLGANCAGCAGAQQLVECECCLPCCDIVTFDCCEMDGTYLWSYANMNPNPANQPYSYDRSCLLKETIAHYENKTNKL